MQFELKFKSIAMKWFINIFSIVVLVIAAFVAIFSILFSSIYIERISSLASDYAYEFRALSNTTSNTFYETAVSIAEEFEHKDKIEVQVIDTEGFIVVSTTGFQAYSQDMPDYTQAMTTGRDTVRRYISQDDEKIMAGTCVLYNSSEQIIGAYRWSTSLSAANRMIRTVIIIISLVGLAVIAFCAFSGIFFIGSIVKPIRDVSNIARKIAMGDFDSRIEIKKNDEIGELCDTINYMATELSQAENMKNDFISSVSHELRTPLTAIRGWGETAKMSIGTDEELVKRGLDVVLTEADRLSGLVEELLDFSRMETGRMVLESQPLNITKLLAESVDMYYELARRQGIEVVHTQSKEDVYVLGDTNRLKQVFINIIDNAVKYTESGGQVLINQIVEEACVRITVSDTGVGIAAEDIDRVKEKFFKANKTVRGSGIGLAVADEIIKQHQGFLFIESTENVGTTATIVIPLYEEIAEIEEAMPQAPENEIDGLISDKVNDLDININENNHPQGEVNE